MLGDAAQKMTGDSNEANRTKEVMRSGQRTVGAENREMGGMHGRRGRARESEGAETATHGMGENTRESTAYQTRRAM